MFEDPARAKSQILKDKHTLLEGYVTEYLYERQFLWQSPEQYTRGWWAAEKFLQESKFHQRFFFVVKEELNDVDRAVMQKLSRWNFPCWWVCPSGDTWCFKHGDRTLTTQQFFEEYKEYGLDEEDSTSVANSVRDPERQNRCIAFFEKHGLVREIATERYFADDFLSVHFDSLVNIDFFKQTDDGQLRAIEVKFKFESRNGTFGINWGQYFLFEQLRRLGIPVEHWILYNSLGRSDAKKKGQKDCSIFTFLTQSGEKYWLSGYIHTNGPRKDGTAPAETSVTGKREQRYYEFDKREFNQKTPLKII